MLGRKDEQVKQPDEPFSNPSHSIAKRQENEKTAREGCRPEGGAQPSGQGLGVGAGCGRGGKTPSTQSPPP